jgi:ADP-ribose pyrophosphatase YjhB (NUDIX family)
MKQLHQIQLQILKKLLFSEGLKYSETKPNKEMDNNQFNFHLEQLLEADLVSKANKIYTLTSIGKEYACRMDTEKVEIQKQAKISVFVCPVRTFKGNKQYLIYTRLKQPFYGCQGFMSGKVSLGEKVLDAAKRELKEETNLEADLKLVALIHYTVYDKNKTQMFEDKFMFLCIGENPKGKLKSNEDGKFERVNKSDLLTYTTNHFVSQKQFIKDINMVDNFNGEIFFEEIDHLSDKY